MSKEWREVVGNTFRKPSAKCSAPWPIRVRRFLACDRVQNDVMRNLEMIGEVVTKFRVKANFCRKVDPVVTLLFRLSATIGRLVCVGGRPVRHL